MPPGLERIYLCPTSPAATAMLNSCSYASASTCSRSNSCYHRQPAMHQRDPAFQRPMPRRLDLKTLRGRLQHALVTWTLSDCTNAQSSTNSFLRLLLPQLRVMVVEVAECTAETLKEHQETVSSPYPCNNSLQLFMYGFMTECAKGS